MPLSLSEAFFSSINVVVVVLPWRTVMVLFGKGTEPGGDQYSDVKFELDTTVAVRLNGRLDNLYTKF